MRGAGQYIRNIRILAVFAAILLAGASERPAVPMVSTSVAFVSSGWVFPGVPLRPAGSDPTNPVIREPANPYARALLSRPPGSLLPVSAYQN